jgi:hypothetical protein
MQKIMMKIEIKIEVPFAIGCSSSKNALRSLPKR